MRGAFGFDSCILLKNLSAGFSGHSKLGAKLGICDGSTVSEVTDGNEDDTGDGADDGASGESPGAAAAQSPHVRLHTSRAGPIPS